MDDKSRIIEKIKKCLRLAASAGENEAAIAMRQAQKLMAANGISISDVHLSDVKEMSGRAYRARNLPAYLVRLSMMVAGVFRCEVVQSAYGATGLGWEVAPKFVGVAPNPELAQYAYDTLSRQLTRQRREFMSRSRASTNAADLYAEGWVVSAAKLTQKLAIPEEHKALIAAYREGKMHVEGEAQTKHRQPSSNQDLAALHAGLRDGKDAQIHAGMSAEKRAQIGAKASQGVQ